MTDETRDEKDENALHDGPSPHSDGPEGGSSSQDRPGNAADPEAGSQDSLEGDERPGP